jgi:hypothetical protein
MMKSLTILTLIFLLVSCIAPQPDKRTKIERGRYLVQIMGCNDCHTVSENGGDNYGPEENWLTGGGFGFTGAYGTVYPTNLRLLVNDLSEDEWLVLAQQMRSGSPMAWTKLPSLTNQDLKSIYRFVRHLGPKGKPAPEKLPAGIMPTTDFIPFPLPH